MGRFVFDSRDGHCIVIDNENHISVEWESGRYNVTNQIKYSGDSLDAMKIARMSRELADYVLAQYRCLL